VLQSVLAELRHEANLNYGETAQVGLNLAVEIVAKMARETET
jgi:hypothetical protein